MIKLEVILDGDGAWPDLANKKIIRVTQGIQIAGLSRGMTSGAPSVSIRIDLPDGRTVIAETSLKLFVGAAEALKAKYGV